MPITRTSSRQLVRDSVYAPLMTSSQDSTQSTSTKRRKDNAAKPRPVVLGEVIEISSDDDEPVPQINHVLIDLRRQVKKLKEENSHSKAELASCKNQLSDARKEILELKTSRPGKGKLVLDLSKADDDTSCEICTSRMWSPFILPECGHTFCQPCLQDWFSATHAQFMATHPDYDGVPNNNHHLEALIQNPHLLRNPHAAGYFAQLRQQFPRPQYTCPTCRELVKNRPVEDFALKGLIWTIATAAGETSPKKAEKPNRGKAPAVSRAGPWDNFFPRVA